MRLRSLKVEPNSPFGWYSEELEFGKHVTQLFGPNGCGKTPVIQAIAHALGHPVKFRDDVLKNCRAASLSVANEARTLTLVRTFEGRFDVEVREQGQDVKRFYNEKDYSRFLFEILGIKTSVLTSTGNEPVEPYIATLLPLFYLDQDHGYTTVYRSPANFIKDQYAEMVRLAFALPAKHSFDRHKLRIEKTRRVALLDRQIAQKAEFINDVTTELGSTRRSQQQIVDELDGHRARLEEFKASRNVKSDAYRAIDNIIFEKRSALSEAERELRDLQARVDGFDKIKREIEVEVSTLSLNEEARRLFASFEDICARADCGLFLGSSDSYGKNLLYLRDQVKDLQNNTSSQMRRIGQLDELVSTLAGEIERQEQRQAELKEATEVASLVKTISELTARVIDLQRELRTVAELDSEESEYVSLLNERDALQNELAVLTSPSGHGDLRAIELRASLRDRVRHWLDVLDTKNVPREVAIDADFSVTFGEEKIIQFTGSTLTRVVLAVHSAIFELYLKDSSNQLRFLILDTPRQQDIEAAALGAYIAELKKVARHSDAQIVFSTTEFHYKSMPGDIEWIPSFPGPEQRMFFGSHGE